MKNENEVQMSQTIDLLEKEFLEWIKMAEKNMLLEIP